MIQCQVCDKPARYEAGNKKHPEDEWYPYCLSCIEGNRWVRDVIFRPLRPKKADSHSRSVGQNVWNTNKIQILAEQRVAMQVTRPKSFVNITVGPC